jgi:hypothetical protein
VYYIHNEVTLSASMYVYRYWRVAKTINLLLSGVRLIELAVCCDFRDGVASSSVDLRVTFIMR